MMTKAQVRESDRQKNREYYARNRAAISKKNVAHRAAMRKSREMLRRDDATLDEMSERDLQSGRFSYFEPIHHRCSQVDIDMGADI